MKKWHFIILGVLFGFLIITFLGLLIYTLFFLKSEYLGIDENSTRDDVVQILILFFVVISDVFCICSFGAAIYFRDARYIYFI